MAPDFRQNGHHDPRGSTLQCRAEVISDCTVIHVSGEVDLATAPILERALAGAVAKPYPIILDFAATSYIDSTGLQVLLQARRRHDRVVAVAGLPPTLRRVFELTNVDRTIPPYPTLAEALATICRTSEPNEVAGAK